MMRLRRTTGKGSTLGAVALAGVLAAAAAVPGAAMTIVVRDDVHMTAAADAVVHGTVASVEARLHATGRVHTHTVLLVEEVWKGDVGGDRIEIVEPGGVTAEAADWIPGVPRFRAGQELVLFLVRQPDGTWSVLDFWAGAFRVLELADGRAILSRAPHGEALRLYGPALREFMDEPRDLAAFRSWIEARTEGRYVE